MNCKTCKQPLKQVFAREYHLDHYWCSECQVIWADSPQGWIPCELPEKHVPHYQDLIRPIGKPQEVAHEVSR